MNLKAHILSFVIPLCTISLLNAKALTHPTDRNGPKKVLPAALLKIANEAYELNIKGLKLLELKKYQEAFDYFEKATIKVPNYSDALNNKGVVYFRRGNISLATELWKKVIKIDPEYGISYYNLGMIAFHDKKINIAKNFFLKALENKKRFAEAYIMLGKIDLQSGEKKSSLHQFKKAYRINPDFIEAWENYAFALIQNGDTATAEKILLNNKNTNSALVMLGQISAGKGNNKKAVSYFTKAYSNGGDPSILLQLATVHYETRQYLSAYRTVKKLLKQVPNPSADAWLLAGLCSKECETIAKTRYYLEKGLYYYPNDQIIRFNLGQVYFYQKNFRKANKIWSSLSDTINDPTLFHLRAIAAYKQQNKSLAKVYIEKAISLDSKAEYYDLLGIVLHDKGRDREAKKQFKKALTLNSSLRSAQLNLSILENNDTDISRLIKSWRNELKQYPDKHRDISLRLSILYYHKRLYLNAIEVLENIPENQKTLKIYSHLALYYKTVAEWKNAIKILEIADKKFKIDLNTQYELAETYLHAGLYTKAIKRLSKCIGSWNKNPWRLYYQLGYSHVKNNNLKKAKIYLKKSLRRKRDNIAARGLLAYVFNELGQKEKARNLWERNCKDDPLNPTIWINLGLLLEGEKKYKLAIEKFKKALSVNPDDKSININIGHSYEQMGMIEKALEYYIDALKSNKRIIAVYNTFLASKKIDDTSTTQMSIKILKKEFPHSIYTMRANSEMLLWRGDTSSAMVSFENLPEKNAFDWYALARIYLTKKSFSSFKRAVKNLPDDQQWSNIKKRLRAEYIFLEGRYQEAFHIWLEIDDDSFEAQYNKALSAFYAERYRAAIQIGKKLLSESKKKDKIDIYRLLCNSTLKLKDWKQATVYFLKMSEFAPDDPLIWYNLAVTAYNQDDMANSWKWYKKSQKIDPKIINSDIENRYRTTLTSTKDECLTDLDFLYNQAVKLQYSENDSAAERIYQQILKKNEKHYRAWNNLGAIYGERAELQKAIHCYKNSISEKKDAPDGYANLVIIYLALNDFKLAEKWLKKGMHRAPGSNVLKKMKTQLQNAKMKR